MYLMSRHICFTIFLTSSKAYAPKLNKYIAYIPGELNLCTFIGINKAYRIVRENYLPETYPFRRYTGKMDSLSPCFNSKYELSSFKSH